LNQDGAARKNLNQKIESIIAYQSQKFCKRFCHDNRYHFSCTLPFKGYATNNNLPLCEWGNACYGWMLEELTSDNRLLAFRADNNASYQHYCYMIANSVPFYERWKNWRFSRRIHIPAYIIDIDEKASAVFLALQNGEGLSLIAHNLKINENEIRNISRQIVIELTNRKRLYLLDLPSSVSMSALSEDDNDMEIADAENIEVADVVILQEEKELLSTAWKQLNALEKFVLESLVIDKQDASDVLNTIKQQSLDFFLPEASKINDRQQLYYFRRKALVKLSELFSK